MGQRANSGRNATLDEKKRRTAGRGNTNSPERGAIKDAAGVRSGKGPVRGAFGRDGVANREASGAVKEGGGGGGGADSKSRVADVGRSKRPAKKR